jgi:protease-4
MNNAFDRFKDVIRSGRPKFAEDPEALERVATGEIFSTPLAQELGLVDQTGFLEEAIERAMQLADLSADQVRVVRYDPPASLLRAVGGLKAGARGADRRWEVFTPQAYYLWSTLPAAVPAMAN